MLSTDPPLPHRGTFFGRPGGSTGTRRAGSDSALLATNRWVLGGVRAVHVLDGQHGRGAHSGPPSALLVMLRSTSAPSLLAEVETRDLTLPNVDTPWSTVFRSESPGVAQCWTHLPEPALPESSQARVPHLDVDLRPGVPLLPLGGRSPPVQCCCSRDFPAILRRAGICVPDRKIGWRTITGSMGRPPSQLPLRGTDDLVGSRPVFRRPRGWTTLQVEDAQTRLFFEE